MPLTATEQEIYNHVRGAMPPWFFAQENADEFMGAIVKVFDKVREYREMLVDQTFILTADNGTPDWLGEHARDRGTRQQSGELADQLRERLRSFPDALTVDSLQQTIDEMLDAAGVVGVATLLDLRPNRAAAGTFASLTGTGGVIANGTGANVRIFSPTTAPNVAARVNRDTLLLSGCPTAGNDGEFTITGHVGNGYQYTNASGVAESAPAASWSWRKRKASPSPALMDGFGRCYMTRGYRMGADRHTLVVMLPFGTSAGLAASITEMLRATKGAGIKLVVERRLNP